MSGAGSSAYRNPDDLAAAQRRVAELEAEIAAIPPPRKPRSLIVMAVISSVIAVATVIASLILVFWIRGKDKEARDKANAEAAAAAAGTPTTSATTPPPPPPKPTVRVYTNPYGPALRAPIYRDINDDGTADIIMLLWDASAASDSRIRLAAIDGKNMNVIWAAGPWSFASQTGDVDVTLTEAGSYVVVTDRTGTAHSLDRNTGKKSHEFKPPEKPTPQFKVCAAPDGRPAVAVFPSPAHPHEYDLGDRKEISHSNDPYGIKALQGWCEHHYKEVPACGDPTTVSGLCVNSHLTKSPSPNMKKASRSFEDTDLMVTFGKDQDGAPYFVTQSGSGGAITWEGLASVEDNGAKKNTIHTLQYSREKVFALYENTDGQVRLVGRDARKGTPLFSTTVNVRGANITTRELDVMDDEKLLFVRLSEALVIYDMLGNEKRTIDQVTLDVEKPD